MIGYWERRILRSEVLESRAIAGAGSRLKHGMSKFRSTPVGAKTLTLKLLVPVVAIFSGGMLADDAPGPGLEGPAGFLPAITSLVEDRSPDPAPARIPDERADLESLRSRLEQAMAQLGVLDEDEGRQCDQRLRLLAQESAKLADGLAKPRLKLQGQNFALQARYLQAERARRRRDRQEASHRVGQLRSGAWRIKQIAAPAAASVGDFWLLQADLFDLNRSGLDLDNRQRQAMELMERFLGSSEPGIPPSRSDPQDFAILHHVGRALVHLYDQRGLSAKLKRRMEQLQAAPGFDLSRARKFGYLDWIGRPLEVELPTTDGIPWSPHDHRGKVVLLAFEGHRGTPSLGRQAKRSIAGRPNFSVVNIAPRRADRKWSAGWLGPTCRDPQAIGDLYRKFAIRDLPRYVIVDHNGNVAAVGGPMIGDALDRILRDRQASGSKGH